MNVFDERLRRAKYSYFMAVSQRVDGFGPASFGFSLYAGGPYAAAPTLQRQVQTPAATPAPSAQPHIRRVRATLLHRPEEASPPYVDEPVAWEAPAQATSAQANAPQAAPPLWTPAPPTPVAPAPVAPPTPAPIAPMQDMADPYGDLAQALAEGLSPTPPHNMPVSPLLPRAADTAQSAEAEEPVARAGRPASFAETMAINEERQRARTAPEPTPAAPAPNLPAPTLVAPEAEQVAPPQTAPAAPQSAAPLAPVQQAPAPQETAPEEAAPRSVPEVAPVAPATAEAMPTPAQQGVTAAPETPAPVAQPTEQAEPVAQTPAVEVAAELAADSGAAIESPINESPATESAVAESAATEAENGQPIDPSLPPPPELLKPLGEAEREERAALEALLKEKNGGVAVRLPRRPRPNVAAKPKEPEEETPPPPPEIPLEVSQNFLARLNRFAEMEKQGETDEGALTYGRMENWQSHNPENNVSASDIDALLNPAAAPAQAAAPTPSVPNVPRPANAVVPPSAPAASGPIPAVARFKARATSRAKEVQTAAPRQATSRDDSDEEAEPRSGISPSPSAVRPEMPRPEAKANAVTSPTAAAPAMPAPQTAASPLPRPVEAETPASVQPEGVQSQPVSIPAVAAPNTAASSPVVMPNPVTPAFPTTPAQAQAPSRPVVAATAPTPTPLTRPTPAAPLLERPSFSQVQTPIAAIQRLSTNLAQPVLAPNAPESALRPLYSTETSGSESLAGIEAAPTRPLSAAPAQASVQARVLAGLFQPQRPIVVPRVLRAGAELSNTPSLFAPTAPTLMPTPPLPSPNAPFVLPSRAEACPSEAAQPTPETNPTPETSSAPKVNVWPEQPAAPAAPQPAESRNEVTRKVAAMPEAQALLEPLLQPASQVPETPNFAGPTPTTPAPEPAATPPQNAMALPSEQYASPLAPQQIQKAALAAWELLEQALLPVEAASEPTEIAESEGKAAAPAENSVSETPSKTAAPLDTTAPELAPLAEQMPPVTAQPKNLALADMAASALLAQALAPVQAVEELAQPRPFPQLEAGAEPFLPPSLNQMQEWLPPELLDLPQQFASAFSATPTWSPVPLAELPAQDFPAAPHLTTLRGPESHLAEPVGIREEVVVPSQPESVDPAAAEPLVGTPPAAQALAPLSTSPLWEPLPPEVQQAEVQQAEAPAISPATPRAESAAPERLQAEPLVPLAPDAPRPAAVEQDTPLGQAPSFAEPVSEVQRQAVASPSPLLPQNAPLAAEPPAQAEAVLAELTGPQPLADIQNADPSASPRQSVGLPIERAVDRPEAPMPEATTPERSEPISPALPNAAVPSDLSAQSDQGQRADLGPAGTRPIVSPVNSPVVSPEALPAAQIAQPHSVTEAAPTALPLAAQPSPAPVAFPVADLPAPAATAVAGPEFARPAPTTPVPATPLSPSASPLEQLRPAGAAQRTPAAFAAPQARPLSSQAPVAPASMPTPWPTGAVPHDAFVSQPALAQLAPAAAFNWLASNPVAPVALPAAWPANLPVNGSSQPAVPAPLAQPAPLFAPQNEWPTFAAFDSAADVPVAPWPSTAAPSAPLEPFFSPEAVTPMFGNVAPAPFAAPLGAPIAPLMGTPLLTQPLPIPTAPTLSAENNWPSASAPLSYAPNSPRSAAAPAFPVGLPESGLPVQPEPAFSPSAPSNPASFPTLSPREASAWAGNPTLGEPFPAPFLAQQTLPQPQASPSMQWASPVAQQPLSQPALASPRLSPPLPQPTASSPNPFVALTEYAMRQEGHAQPLPASTQDALQRTLGTSVRDIRVVRNPAIEPALRRANAEALTVGKTVLLPAHVDLNTPAGFALAAHELTHALRHDQPNFVPEVLRRQAARPNLTAPNWQSEEAVALATEHATVHEQAGQRHPSLPAPWEPLPFWSPSTPEAASQNANSSSRRAPAAEPSAPSMPPPSAALPTQVHAAEMDRPKASSPNPAAPAPSTSKPTAVGNRDLKTPKVDLDQVARDVYQRLRDRLNEEFNRLRS